MESVGAVVAFYCACSGGMLVLNKLAVQRNPGDGGKRRRYRNHAARRPVLSPVVLATVL